MPESRRLRLEVELCEDLHSGTGATAGALDAVQARDRNGNPVIRASHLKGLWKQAATELVLLEDDHAKRAALEKDMLALFGGSGPGRTGALTMASLRFERREEPARFLAWTSTARREGDRGPLDDSMRTVEYVGAGTRFAAQLELLDDRLEDLLRRCIRRTTALGADRTRGAGLVRTKVTRLSKPAPGKRPQPSPRTLRLRLLLANQDPVCLPRTGVPGNIIRSECYIRGQAVIGALANWAMRRGRPASALADGSGLRVGNAYPLPANLELPNDAALRRWEVIPIPLTMRVAKPAAQLDPNWPWWAEDASAPVGAAADDGGTKRPKDHEFLFRSHEKAKWQRFTPELDIRLRNNAGEHQRGPDGGEARKQQLFSTEEIAEDTLFLCDVVFGEIASAAAFSQTFEDVLRGESWLTVGRGGAPVTVRGYAWMDGPAHPRQTGSGSLTVTLTSDLIARGPTLGFYDALTPQMLARLAFGAKAPETGLADAKWTIDWKETASDQVEVRGFNAASGLPRPPALAIRRGSCLAICGEPKAVAKLYAGLAERSALGERVREGFGTFRLDPGRLEVAAQIPEQPSADEDISDSEQRLAEAEAFVRGYHEEVTATQWMTLWHQVMHAPDRKAIDTALAAAKAVADKRRGTNRKNRPPDTEPISNSLNSHKITSERDTRVFLDAVIRAKVRGAKAARSDPS